MIISEYFKKDLNPLAVRLFEALEPGKEALINVALLADQFLKNQSSVDEQENGLLAFLFTSSFSDYLSKDQKGSLEEIVGKARERHGLVDQTLDRIQLMGREVDGYFNHQSYAYDYIQSAPVPSILATAIISLQAHRIAASTRDKFAGGNIIVEAFLDPKNNQPGVWMSTQGIHFDPAKLESQTAA